METHRSDDAESVSGPPYLTLLITATLVLLNIELFMGGSGLIRLLELNLSHESLFPQEFWRLWTGHLVHWTRSHFLWDGILFLLIGWVYEGRGRWWFLGSFLTIAMITGVGLLFVHRDVEVYRGLSGVNHGLLAYGLVLEVGSRTVVGLIFLALLVGKVMYETVTGSLITSSTGMFAVEFAEFSHFWGLLGGVICGLTYHYVTSSSTK